MSSVTELRRTPLQLAEVSGTPRPVVLPGARPPSSGPARVIALHPTGASQPDGAIDAGTAVTKPPPIHRTEPPLPSASQLELSRRISGIARSVAQGSLEVLNGSRPLQQLARWLDPESYERLHLRANLVRCITTAPSLQRSGEVTSAHRQVIIRSARVCEVSATVFEASVVAFDQKRVRAVALRIERRRGAWRVTALEIG